MSEPLHYLEITELAQRLHAKELSPVDVVEAQLARIRAIDPGLHSYLTVLPELALAQAKQAEAEIARGEIRGPLHGVPIAVKDLCWTKGEPTSAGMAIHRNFRPDQDATVVRKLREAGAVLLGKLGQTEGAYADHHPQIPAPLNPWNKDHWVGSSSSGSGVATAAGLCYGSLGSDTGGSIRFPSNANNVTGIKPTWGRVSRFGVFELAATLDHVGPMTRSARDAAAMLAVIAGADPLDPTASLLPVADYVAAAAAGRDRLKRYRFAIDPRWNNDRVDEPTRKAMDQVLAVFRDLGVQFTEVRFPDVEQVVSDWNNYCAIETAVAHEATYPARKSEYGPGLASLIEIGRAQSAMDYQKMILRRQDFAGRVQALFQDIDLLVIPTTAVASPTNAQLARLGEDAELLSGMLRFTCPFDLSRNPTITLPCGFTDVKTPIGFQIVSGLFDEEALSAAGAAFQSATDWHKQRPPLAD